MTGGRVTVSVQKFPSWQILNFKKELEFQNIEFGQKPISNQRYTEGFKKT
jgi:hypothetical protein